MKEPIGFLGQTDLTSQVMHKMSMQTVEPVSTREATERLVKILDSTYVKLDLEQVAANASQLDIEERSQRLSLLQNFN